MRYSDCTSLIIQITPSFGDLTISYFYVPVQYVLIGTCSCQHEATSILIYQLSSQIIFNFFYNLEAIFYHLSECEVDI